MKKLFSTAGGRLFAVALAIVILYALSTAVSHTVPFMIMSAVKNRSLKPDARGVIKLPWYWSFAAIDGVAMATVLNGDLVILLPQDAGSDSNFTGLLVADRVIPPAQMKACSSGSQCVNVTAGSQASDPTTLSSVSVALHQVGNSRLYEAVVAESD